MERMLLAGCLLWLGTNVVGAAETTIRDARVEWISAIANQPGQCAMKLDRAIDGGGDSVVDCEGQTVAFDCATPSSGGPRTLDLAMLAFDSCRPVDVRVSDDAKIYNACVATQVWVKRHPRSRYYYDDDDYDDRYDDDDYDDGYQDDGYENYGCRLDDDGQDDDRWGDDDYRRGDDDDSDDDDDDRWDDDDD